jgi:hypothetical protein
MTVLRSAVAVVAGIGFLMTASLVGGTLSTVVARLMVGGLAALIAGWIAARLAPFSPFGHAVVLALIVAAASISVFAGGPAPAAGFTAIAGAVAVVFILVGGAIRAAAGAARGTLNTRQPS